MAWRARLARAARAGGPGDAVADPRPGPPGDPNRLESESPALVDLLTGGWKLCEEAAAATVLDLAARRVVSVEEIGPELSLVRLAASEPTGLNTYEQMVLDHLAGSPPPTASSPPARWPRATGSSQVVEELRQRRDEEARARGLSEGAGLRRTAACSPSVPPCPPS